ncbi:hypothetical protein DdX_07457 [Ditylenchus destructor]|uniref:Uncharacterized protein n=1 Tax=Ditylenchus destructor TaxID=166010 RepID=A0AAD4N9W7_9BILA|nr:hypothetical protein DdX_07457 [Ditylenchus destructor]
MLAEKKASALKTASKPAVKEKEPAAKPVPSKAKTDTVTKEKPKATSAEKPDNKDKKDIKKADTNAKKEAPKKEIAKQADKSKEKDAKVKPAADTKKQEKTKEAPPVAKKAQPAEKKQAPPVAKKPQEDSKKEVKAEKVIKEKEEELTDSETEKKKKKEEPKKEELPKEKPKEKDIDEEVDEQDDEEQPEEIDEAPKKSRKRRRKRKKKRIITKKVTVKKMRWVRPPITPPEPVEMPPNERRLYEILKEELKDGLRPVKRYIRKDKPKEVVLPMNIPWEHLAALESQAGMGAFGQQRDPKIKIEDGEIKLVQGNLKSETVLPLFENNTKYFASQKGFAGFGGHRKNVDQVVDHHIYESSSKLQLCEGIIPKIMMGTIAEHDMRSFGSLRPQNMKVRYREGMKEGFDKESNTFLSRQFKPNSSDTAGSRVIDRRRGIVATDMKHSRLSECIVPKMFSNDEICTKEGADFGSFRPLISQSTGGYNMNPDDEKLCKFVIPYQTGPSLNC